MEQCWTVTPCPFPHGDLHLVLPGLNLSILDVQHIDNGAASKKLDLGLDLIDPRSSFIHISINCDYQRSDVL